MPRRQDLQKILIIGSGPIVIGQACEFDYSGTQACKVLRAEGIEIVLVNSNPATIMTDPELTDRTYIEPITSEVLTKIIARESPDALLPTLGGQTALNAAAELATAGVLEAHGVELIGASLEAIRVAEDRRLFKEAMIEIGLDLPESGYAYSSQQALETADRIGYPLIVRASYALGGGGSGVAFNDHELKEVVAEGLELSPISEVLVEQSVLGWKEYELEVMRDVKDNFVVVCSIENVDPMGVHTGDSITVAPAQTLTDREFQAMRDASASVMRRVGVETGGSNVQFAVNPADGRMVVIEMNPRVSRSSALASKATGFPIAKIATKLALGYTLDEIPNDITRKTPASFEPTIDYVVVKFPRWAFEKFPDADQSLGTRMKSVGEAMALGRTFPEALQKAIRALEVGRLGLGGDSSAPDFRELEASEILLRLARATEDRLWEVLAALDAGVNRNAIVEASGIDEWFVAQIEKIRSVRDAVATATELDRPLLRRAKRAGFCDAQIANLRGIDETQVSKTRLDSGVIPQFSSVDTCAGEFEAVTPYFYSTYEDSGEKLDASNRSVVILGSGPNRIGQGIEFDYCCVHAAFAVRDAGYDAVMVNCNPETVSTDYDTSTRLYFEPLSLENVMNILDRENPEGVIVSLGGQTPLKLAESISRAGVRILGTNWESIDAAEDRGKFTELLSELGIAQAPGGVAYSESDAVAVADEVGYPVVVRPSYVLGGRAMEIVYGEEMLRRYIVEAVDVSARHPVLIDKFLEGAIEVDVDAVSDGSDVYIGGIMEHIEEAGIHSGDSACVIPPFSLSDARLNDLVEATRLLSKALDVVGLINVQFAVRDESLFCLEVNPRASRTVPFVGKATGVPLAKVATRAMLGEKLADMEILPEESPGRGWWGPPSARHFAVKEAVLPFGRFPGVDTLLGPEMKSTGEVMGIHADFGTAFARSQAGGGSALPEKGRVFISVADRDKRAIVLPAKRLAELGFEIRATKGTADVLGRAGVPVKTVGKFSDGPPNIVEDIMAGEIDLVINTPFGRSPRSDGYYIRTAASRRNIPCITTISGVLAVLGGIESTRSGDTDVRCLQEYYEATRKSVATL